MARKKQYNEEEVIEKAMRLFWRNGYNTTSTRMLEKEMGINQFSIYSSFGNKEGVLLESMKRYRKEIETIVDKLKHSSNGVEAIKQYFYDVIEFTHENGVSKGCLYSNTTSELGADSDANIWIEIRTFTRFLQNIFIEKLSENATKSDETVQRQSNYLMVSISGLTTVSKGFNEKYIKDYIETVFAGL